MDSDEEAVDELSLLMISSVTIVLRSLDELNSSPVLATVPAVEVAGFAATDRDNADADEAEDVVDVSKLVVSVTTAFIDDETDTDMDDVNRSASEAESPFSPVSTRVPELLPAAADCLLA